MRASGVCKRNKNEQIARKIILWARAVPREFILMPLNPYLYDNVIILEPTFGDAFYGGFGLRMRRAYLLFLYCAHDFVHSSFFFIYIVSQKW
jgi:hypothetical protein